MFLLLSNLKRLLWTRRSNKIFDQVRGYQTSLLKANKGLDEAVKKNAIVIANLGKVNSEIAETQARNARLVEKIEDMLK